MEINVKPGKYVVAVSGGVDSMVLLDLLARLPNLTLVVAHFDHGIRPDSGEDARLVAVVAARYGLAFASAEGRLGPRASEAAARDARYSFLRRVREEQEAAAIITAHHQDDLIETALINMLRGTGPRGLGSLHSTDEVLRPLLHVPKTELRGYAAAHDITWREDSTNADERYLRNYLRRRVLPALTPGNRAELVRRITETAALHAAIEQELAPYVGNRELNRTWFIQLPYDVSTEAMAAWLRVHNVQFDRKTIHRLVVFAKTARPGKLADAGAHHALHASKKHITISPQEPKG
jgi:tRNA(Ile)-lysidine synthase